MQYTCSLEIFLVLVQHDRRDSAFGAYTLYIRRGKQHVGVSSKNLSENGETHDLDQCLDASQRLQKKTKNKPL